MWHKLWWASKLEFWSSEINVAHIHFATTSIFVSTLVTVTSVARVTLCKAPQNLQQSTAKQIEF